MAKDLRQRGETEKTPFEIEENPQGRTGRPREEGALENSETVICKAGEKRRQNRGITYSSATGPPLDETEQAKVEKR